MVSSISIILYVKEKTREQKEAELIPKVQEAVNYGLKVLESAFEQLDIKAGNSDSEDEETLEKVEPILEAKVNASLQSLSTYLIIRQLLYIISGFGVSGVKMCEKKLKLKEGTELWVHLHCFLCLNVCLLVGPVCGQAFAVLDWFPSIYGSGGCWLGRSVQRWWDFRFIIFMIFSVLF